MKTRIVIDLRDRRPIWELPEWARREIRAALPAGWRVHFMETASDGSGDGAGQAGEELLAAVADARVYMGYGIPAEVLENAPRLEWVHSGAAGVASSLHPAMLASRVLFTNSAGIHAVPMAETAMAMILYFARGFDMAVAAQREGRWAARAWWRADAPVREVGGAKVGVLGYGGIGREVAKRARALGAKVTAVRRRPGVEAEAAGPEAVALAGGGAAGEVVAATEVVVGKGGLGGVVAGSDYLVLCLPETPETRGILTRERLFRMKRGSVLINVARGRLVDEEALLDALGPAGPLRGAGLDVFHREPLPAGHPFYAHPAFSSRRTSPPPRAASGSARPNSSPTTSVASRGASRSAIWWTSARDIDRDRAQVGHSKFGNSESGHSKAGNAPIAVADSPPPLAPNSQARRRPHHPRKYRYASRIIARTATEPITSRRSQLPRDFARCSSVAVA